MLSTLAIRDVVLIDRLDLRFARGLCALTGETGAGKSILLDALGLAVGWRADARLVRHGADQASVSAVFEVAPDHPVCGLLDAHGLAGDDGEPIVLRRTLGADGRSRAYVNDQPISVAMLRRVGETLVEVHGQFESQRLLDAATHRELLDSFAGLDKALAAAGADWQRWRDAAKARERAAADVAEARRDEDYLRHNVDELNALSPVAGEESALAERRAVLMNAERLTEALGAAIGDLTTPAGSIEETLRAAIRRLDRLAVATAGRMEPVIAALDRAAVEAAEGLALLERVAAEMEPRPAELEQVEERLFALRAAARKHGCPVDDLADVAAAFARRLATIDDGSATLERLAADEAEARTAYMEAAEALSAARHQAAADLDAAVAAELEPLKLGRAVFRTRVDALPESEWAGHGRDRVTFEVATNPGTPPGPLARIASGGELARFMLALKVVLAGADPVQTLVFDEVDAGIGGAVAAAVGERLARLAGDAQVLVLTHSPQVAARGDYHWRVTKADVANGARTAVEPLDAPSRKEEIARMLAGARITDEARAAADSLLAGEMA